MRNRKILIVDDEAGFTKIVRLALQAKHHYDVREENQPARTVETARKFLPDLILLDVVMPELDGGDVLALLQADPILRRVPVIFLTATVRKKEVDARRGDFGGCFFIAKPVSIDDLIRSIEERITTAAAEND